MEWNTISRVTETVSGLGDLRLMIDQVFTIAVFNRANNKYLKTDFRECAYG